MLIRREFLRLSAASPALLARPPKLFAADYDLVIKGGQVIDPAQRINRVADVGIRGGRIAAIQPDISPSTASEVIDARGKLVTPGLIDIHTHLADPAMTPASCLADGVTSLLDAGSRGAENVDEVLKVAESAPDRVRILVNIATRGIAPGGPGGPGELLDIESANAAAIQLRFRPSRAEMKYV